MIPGNEPPFEGFSSGNSGNAGGNPFSGNGNRGEPPPVDGLFSSAFEEVEELPTEDVPATSDASDVVNVGLHFFEGFKKKE